MSDKAYQTPLVDLLRSVPIGFRAEWPIQWGSEDGSPTGHAMSPIGKHCHEAAERIAELESRLEIDPAHDYDGIDTRDTTIRELEKVASYSLLKQNERLKEEKARLREALIRLWAHVGLSEYPMTKEVTRIVREALKESGNG